MKRRSGMPSRLTDSWRWISVITREPRALLELADRAVAPGRRAAAAVTIGARKQEEEQEDDGGEVHGAAQHMAVESDS